MALSIKSDEADRLAREVARLTGENLTEAVTTSLRERLNRERRRRSKGQTMADRLRALARECASLPDVDPRSPDEIIGYDDQGAPR
jgi:antitoxin VapB